MGWLKDEISGEVVKFHIRCIVVDSSHANICVCTDRTFIDMHIHESYISKYLFDVCMPRATNSTFLQSWCPFFLEIPMELGSPLMHLCIECKMDCYWAPMTLHRWCYRWSRHTFVFYMMPVGGMNNHGNTVFGAHPDKYNEWIDAYAPLMHKYYFEMEYGNDKKFHRFRIISSNVN